MKTKILQVNDHLSPLASLVLQRRYLRKNDQGQVIETPDQLYRRVAGAVALAELAWGSESSAQLWAEEFYKLMVSRSFLPNSPTLMNAGRMNSMLSACFVLPVPDSTRSPQQ